MAWLENQTPASPEEALFLLKRTLVLTTTGQANWQVTKSATGTGGVYAQSGDVVSSAASLGARAWFVTRGKGFPDAGVTYHRELCWQTDAAGGLRVKYSPRSGFSGGSPDEETAPSAADEQYLLGGGTDAAPTFSSHLQAPGQRMQGFSSESDDTFWFLTYPVGGGLPTSLILLDLPTSCPTGPAREMLDKDSALLYARTGTGCALQDDLGREDRCPRSVFRYGTAQELWGRACALASYALDSTGAAARVFPAGMPTSALYSAPTYPQEAVRYARRATLAGVVLVGEVGDANTVDDKGYSRTLRWSGVLHSLPLLVNALSASGGVTPDVVLGVGHLLLCWSGTPIVL